jgi:ribosomal protein L7/L12
MRAMVAQQPTNEVYSMKIVVRFPYAKSVSEVPKVLMDVLETGNDGTEFDYDITSDVTFHLLGFQPYADLNKILKIKRIRQYFCLGLVEAKNWVEAKHPEDVSHVEYDMTDDSVYDRLERMTQDGIIASAQRSTGYYHIDQEGGE